MAQVRTGDKIAINGERGIITEVMEGLDGKTYARIHFEGDLANWMQYQNKLYRDTDFTVIG